MSVFFKDSRIVRARKATAIEDGSLKNTLVHILSITGNRLIICYFVCVKKSQPRMTCASYEDRFPKKFYQAFCKNVARGARTTKLGGKSPKQQSQTKEKMASLIRILKSSIMSTFFCYQYSRL